MKRIVMSVAVATEDDPGGRAAAVASRTIREWTGRNADERNGVTLLSARWEAEDPDLGAAGGSR